MACSGFKQLTDAVYNDISPVSDNHSLPASILSKKGLSMTCVIAFACGGTLNNLPEKNMRAELPL